jgi:putative transposase
MELILLHRNIKNILLHSFIIFLIDLRYTNLYYPVNLNLIVIVMKKFKKDNIQFKSYIVAHKANIIKEDLLFNLYSQYKKEYAELVIHYWHSFLNNQIKDNKFSHLGSTKHITTQLSSGYLQCCLAQACASLNNYLANISTKFNDIINQSSIKDKETLHQLRTINTNHSWLNKTVDYYPLKSRVITDDFGNELTIKYKQAVIIEKSFLRLAKKLFISIVGEKVYQGQFTGNYQNRSKVSFPSLLKPKLVIDDRLYSLEIHKQSSHTFDYWLNVSTLDKGQRVSIPLLSHEYFESAHGNLGKTIELNFLYHDYQKPVHHHQSLNAHDGRTKKINRELSFIFNKKENLDFIQSNIDYSKLVKNVAFDLGLCNLFATSDGELYGQYWLEKLKHYDEQLTQLHADRQYCLRRQFIKGHKVKFRSKRYDELVQRIRGFIKSETHRILNRYFETHVNIKTVVIEKLRFSNPDLSKKLNRIIQNFGLKIFKDKLSQLSKLKGFVIEELNPAYTSQECKNCGYVDTKNRPRQSIYQCLCCKKECQADIQAAGVELKRFESTQGESLHANNSGNTNKISYKSLYKNCILRKLKMEFVAGISGLLSRGIICRRELYQLLNKNTYFKDDIKAFARTTEAQGVEPMTVWNFDTILLKYYKEIYNNEVKGKIEEKVSL